eukprot:Gb_30077 [translate_table: standard]
MGGVETEGESSSKGWKLFGIPWRMKGSSSLSSEDQQPIVPRNPSQNHRHHHKNKTAHHQSFATMARASLLTRRRLRFDPDGKLFFLYEPGTQVSSAVRIKNVSRSHVAFKFQTNAPKSCFMRPPNGILAPRESIIASGKSFSLGISIGCVGVRTVDLLTGSYATVVKFVEQPEHEKENKTKDKFKIVSLKVKQGTEYTPELFEEHKGTVAVERVLRVVFLDPQRPSQELEKLKKRLAEAEAIKQAQKKPQDNEAAKVVAPSDGVIDEWKERREKYLAKQQVEVLDSL